jgi:ribosomal-protein-serine acetyltransferase
MNFDNFSLRKIKPGDAPGFFSMIDKNRKELEDFFAGTVAKNKDPEQTRLFIEEVFGREEKRTYFPFLIIDDTKDEIIGYVDIKNIDWNIPKAELGYFIDKDYEGKGIITKAVSVVVNYCFDELKFNKLFLRTHKDNVGSKKVAEKNGFEVEGVIRRDYKTTSGVVVDLIYYGRIKE